MTVREFFAETKEGQQFIAQAKSMVDAEQDMARSSLSRDAVFAHMQRAKGIQDVVELMQAKSVEAKTVNKRH